MAAGQAESQVHPLISELQTFQAPGAAGFHRPDFVNVFADFGHVRLRERSHSSKRVRRSWLNQICRQAACGQGHHQTSRAAEQHAYSQQRSEHPRRIEGPGPQDQDAQEHRDYAVEE